MNNTTLSKPQRISDAERERLAHLKQNMYFECEAPDARIARYAADSANIAAVNAANNIVTNVAANNKDN